VTASHPAKFSDPILWEIDELLRYEETARGPIGVILDPFAGVGRVHELARAGRVTLGVEIEPEWAATHPRTIVGDALDLPFPNASVDAVVTSPTYGNRMADHHNAQDWSGRITYRHRLGCPLHPHNSGQLQWGDRYRNFHLAAWQEVDRVLKPTGLIVLNVSDHIRGGKQIPVAEWHRDTISGMGWQVVNEMKVPTRRMGFGKNRDVRVEYEMIYLFRREPK